MRRFYFDTAVFCRPEANGSKGNTAFYLTPLKEANGNIWFKAVPYGVHSIQKTVSRLMANAGFDGNFSNTSLRRTARTRLLEFGIPDKIARQVTGRLFLLSILIYYNYLLMLIISGHISNAEDAYISGIGHGQRVSDSLYGRTSLKAASTSENVICIAENQALNSEAANIPNIPSTSDSNITSTSSKASENVFRFSYERGENGEKKISFFVPLE